MGAHGGDSLYEVLVNTRDRDSYMESSSSFTFYVCSTAFGDELCRFSGSWDSDASGDRKSGTQTVSIEGHFAVAADDEGREERVELPVAIALASDGDALLLTWADGRTERRARREAIAVTKYGEPFSMKRLVRRAQQ